MEISLLREFSDNKKEKFPKDIKFWVREALLPSVCSPCHEAIVI